jgi:hypothetical protein
MARLSICGTCLVLASAVMFAQPPNGGGPGPVLGIVEIPEMFFVDPISGQYAPRAALTLYTRPDSESKVLVQISHSFCESDEPPTIKGHGWIRAHDKIGAPTVWFSSRGC